MGLNKLSILVEEPGAALKFGSETSDSTIVAMFNPNKLSLGRTVKWEDQKAAKRDTPEMQFTGSDPQTMEIDLLFDTWDSPKAEADKDSVKKLYTDKLLFLTTVQKHGDKHRPPVCQLKWGKLGIFFQGVLQSLTVQFTMFTADGTPVRATTHCTFKRWVSNGKDQQNQDLQSSDIAKVWAVRQGQSLASIAAQEYGHPGAWRLIAEANEIDDPLRVQPGSRLVLPPRRNAWKPDTI